MPRTINFKTDDYPEFDFQIDITPKLFGAKVELRESGKLIKMDDFYKSYLIETKERKLRIKTSISPLENKIIIDGKKYDLKINTPWHDYIIGGFPFLLIISGGILGAVLGVIGWNSNMNYLKYGESPKKYLHVFIITLSVGAIYSLIAGLLYGMIDL